ncbi:hypothetical protein QO004_003529 [Rhizobium mesoamericanum]|nr:hypothetical protein [Rhizobium mesoamericanum]MDQ0561729.1 hypothetical protein [Rhizobium mesoamericanum]
MTDKDVYQVADWKGQRLALANRHYGYRRIAVPRRLARQPQTRAAPDAGG